MRSRLGVGLGVIVAAWACQVFAASVAVDQASNYSAWTNGSNGGSGFGAWQLVPPSNSNNAGFFLGSSANNGSAPSGNINSANGTAFGLYANSGQTASAVRPFTGGALAVGQTLSLQMDNGWIDHNSVVGFSLQTSGGGNVLEFYFRGGTANYIVNVGGVETNTAVAFTDGGLSLAFTLTSPTTYALDVTRLVNNQVFNLTGSFGSAASIERLRLFNFNAGGGSPYDAFFNQLRIGQVAPPPPPEPVIPLPAASLMGMTLLAGLMGRRR